MGRKQRSLHGAGTMQATERIAAMAATLQEIALFKNHAVDTEFTSLALKYRLHRCLHHISYQLGSGYIYKKSVYLTIEYIHVYTLIHFGQEEWQCIFTTLKTYIHKQLKTVLMSNTHQIDKQHDGEKPVYILPPSSFKISSFLLQNLS